MSKTLGILAGGGHLPKTAAESAKSMGYRVAFALLSEGRGRVPRRGCDASMEASLGHARRFIDFFVTENVHDVLLVGKVDKTLNFANLDFDETALAVLGRLSGRADMNIAAVLIDELEGHGFHVREQTEFLGNYLAKPGHLAGPKAPKFDADILTGIRAARAVAALDIGQTVAVREGAVIAVEAFEHTDATIRRAGRLAGGGLVVAKTARPKQDLRFDVPAVGVGTLRAMKKAGASVLAVEAGKILLVEGQRFLRLAEEMGITVVGVSSD